MLQTAQKAPNFQCYNQDNKLITLSDFVGKKLVLYFYPKDDTPGCTAQACNLRDNYIDLLKNGYEILGISPDNEKKHLKFIEKFNLPFDLLADTDHTMATDYHVWGEKSMYGKKYMGIFRTTFVLDEQGTITEIISKVDTSNHTNQLLNR